MGAPERVGLIRSPRNSGFAAGNNIAFEAARALPWRSDAVFLLNPDAELRPGAIEELVRVMRARPRVGVVGGLLENEADEPRASAFRFPSAMTEFAAGVGLGVLVRRWPVALPLSETPVQADWITGACMFINWDLIEAQGPLDEGYFLYFEEVDYQFQARRAGWEVWHAPGARIMHIAGAATGIVGAAPKRGPMPDYWFDSWRLFFEKNYGAAYASRAAALRLAGDWMGHVIRLLRGRGDRRIPGFAASFRRRCLLNRSGRTA